MNDRETVYLGTDILPEEFPEISYYQPLKTIEFDVRYKNEPEKLKIADTFSTLILGSTGKGKSSIMRNFIREILERPSENRPKKTIIFDPSGIYMREFAKEGDYIIGVTDECKLEWSPVKELADFDKRTARLLAMEIASGMALYEKNSHEPFFYNAAKMIISELLIEAQEQEELTIRELCQHLTDPALVQNKKFCQVFGADASGQMSGIFGTLMNIVSFLQYGDFSQDDCAGDERILFSVKDIMASEESKTVFLTFDPSISAEPQSLLLNLWIELFLRYGLSAVNGEMQTRLILDELSLLPAGNGYLLSAINYGRKCDLSITAATQSIPQLKQNYGEAGSNTLLNAFRNLVMMGASDEDTRRFCRLRLGETIYSSKTPSLQQLRHGYAAEDYVWNTMGVGEAIVSLAENEATPVKVYFFE